MGALRDNYDLLRRDLSAVYMQCQALSDEIIAYQHIVSTYTGAQVKLNLGVMELEIVALEASLLQAHTQKGVVFVMMDEDGLGIFWGEK